MNYPPPDAIQEFRLQTSNYGSEYGGMSNSQVSVLSKAGTSQFHGSAYEFLRNDALNSRNFFSSAVPALKQNQFGGSVGGPIRKDKVFFFASYQGLRVAQSVVPSEAFVPSTAKTRW